MLMCEYKIAINGIFRIIFVQFPFGEHQANYHVIQIAGRAGRFQSAYEKGWVKIFL